MALGRLDEIKRGREGRWWAAAVDGGPAVKLFLASQSSSDACDTSLYWKGVANPSHISQFLDSLSKSWGRFKLWDNTQDAPQELGPSDIGAGSPKFPSGRVYLGIRRSEGADGVMDVWADGENATHGLTREVGVAMPHQLLGHEGIEDACKSLLAQTLLGGGSLKETEVSSLLSAVKDTVKDHFQ
jgi:hypothetical protein